MINEDPSPDEPITAIDSNPTEAAVNWVDEQLVAFNKIHAGRYDFKALNLIIRDDSDSIIAGLKSTTGWDWLYVDVLWVDERHRRRGLGSRYRAT